jgi:glutathione S-transferase
MRVVSITTSWAASIARGTVGLSVGRLGPRPAQTLELYEFEACPFCRKAREALTMLDLEALVLPCPKNGRRFRPEVTRRGGKAMFPYLVDPNTGREMYESDDIVRYLYATYGAGPPPLSLRLGPLTTVGAAASGLFRLGRGMAARGRRAPEQPLELWSFEASPYCRLVREALSELELRYLLHNVAKRSPSRSKFIARSGKMQVPYLADPNTGAEMFESAEIVSYLEREYG